jgi:single-stranded DNA-binding protein
LRKGARIGIDGFLRQERWTDKTDGKTRSKVTITTNSIVLMQSKQDQAQQPQPVPEPQPQPHNLTGQAGAVADAFGGSEVYEDAPF